MHESVVHTPRTLFLTGITGAAGGWLAAEALRRGVGVAALVRGPHPRRRLEHALEAAGACELAAAIEVISGDLCAAGEHWDPLADALRGIGLIVHCAARVEFVETPDKLLQRTNVEGTRRILALAERLQVPLVYVSTAYVAGRHTGPSLEDELAIGAGFNNSYERSKHEAETMVRRWAARTAIPTLILRPSILLGDHARGVTTRFNTVYDFMRAFERLAPALGRGAIRVEAAPEATKNILPLDIFARAAWHLIERGATGGYHLTHPEPLPLTALRDIFTRLFGIGRIELVEAGEFRKRPPTRSERIYQRAIEIYQPYLRQEPAFDRRRVTTALAGSGIEPPKLDLAYFERLLNHARRVDWGGQTEEYKMRNAKNKKNDSVQRYFTEFLTGMLGQQLLPDLRNVSARVGIHLTDAPGEQPDSVWILEVRNGALESVTRNGPPPQCAYRVNTQTFSEIVSGRLAPQRAFFERRVDLEGDMELGLRLALILATFFRQHSCEIGEDAA